MTKASDVLREKTINEVYSIAPEASVLDALTLMAEKGVGAILVIQNNQLKGILSERDYARKVALMERSSASTTVQDIMTSQLIVVKPSDAIEDCMEIMTNHRLRHLPVVDNGQLIGLISIGDLVKKVIDEQKKMIRQLQDYITY